MKNRAKAVVRERKEERRYFLAAMVLASVSHSLFLLE